MKKGEASGTSGVVLEVSLASGDLDIEQKASLLTK